MIGGEPNLLSPLVERLAALHELAYGDRLEDHSVARRLAGAEARPSGEPLAVAETRAPAPAAPGMLPRRISASGYNSLVACPYQFYARYVLGLAELDEVQEEIEKSDYGSLLHGVLARFHGDHPVVTSLDPAAAQAELERLSEAAFAGAMARSYQARAWLVRWKGLIPSYIEWQREREAQGWRWTGGEVDRSHEITTPAGRKLTLRGRIDRVDAHEGRFAVVDYKARAVKPLKDSLSAPGEDVQLAVYALLWGEAVSEALFLSIDRGEVAAVPEEGDIQALARATRERLAAVFDSLAGGARLPAQGIAGACEYCEARGLCRKGHWHD
jgi:ATP-dependent helicase/nuclease subunit B